MAAVSVFDVVMVVSWALFLAGCALVVAVALVALCRWRGWWG